MKDFFVCVCMHVLGVGGGGGEDGKKYHLYITRVKASCACGWRKYLQA